MTERRIAMAWLADVFHDPGPFYVLEYVNMSWIMTETGGG
jgi:hypothetical protein